ncbi:hypothetical protein BFN03_11015 [Rhodococcus sp. WMMA185]|uniref:hypothetical protein n=1 Tax=Rhodococcus sp. WMMA185 TaxID=679318 RepID=UPI00087859AF|nr:hypothetical protein [Rhodococcus sp. WMMA185]AOW93006.1 hypothetical protein BFN03_11015 [Rhodococcus sp. WMMA185]
MRILNTAIIATSAIATATVLGPTAYAASPLGFTAAHTIPSNADVTLSAGDEIQPGTYTSAGAATAGTFCFWSVVGPDGTVREGGQTDQTNDRQTATIESTDTFFQTTNCAAWNPSGHNLFGSLSMS